MWLSFLPGGLRFRRRRQRRKRLASYGSGQDRILYEVMAIDDGLVQEITRRVLSATRPKRIILFGSAASGQMNRDSDIDLRVGAPAPANTRQESVKIRSALGDVGYPVDVIVISSDRFVETKSIVGGIAYPANMYGWVLYDAA